MGRGADFEVVVSSAAQPAWDALRATERNGIARKLRALASLIALRDFLTEQSGTAETPEVRVAYLIDAISRRLEVVEVERLQPR